jgi:hypothetical protein
MEPLPHCSCRLPYDSARFFCGHTGVVANGSLVTPLVLRSLKGSRPPANPAISCVALVLHQPIIG